MKRVSGHCGPRHLLVRNNEFLIYPPEKSKWKIGYLRQCLPCFITVACAGLHLGILPSSLIFFFFPLCRGDAVECIISCSSSAVWVCHFRTFHQPRIICLFAWLAFTNRSCALLQSCKAFSLSSCAAVLYNTCFVSSGKAHLSSSCRDHNDWLWSPSLLTWKRKKENKWWSVWPTRLQEEVKKSTVKLWFLKIFYCILFYSCTSGIHHGN